MAGAADRGAHPLERPGESLDLYVVDIDGSHERRVAENAMEPAWSPDGRRIAFVSDRQSGLSVYVVDVDGSLVVRITHGPGYESYPAWSPDGRRIGYVANPRGNTDIYVAKLEDR